MLSTTATSSSAAFAPAIDSPEQRVEDRQMAAHLEAHHGRYAVAMARFFVTSNILAGDPARAQRWDGIANRILLRQRLRLLED